MLSIIVKVTEILIDKYKKFKNYLLKNELGEKVDKINTKNKSDIMLIANYWHFEEEKASSRYRTMANIIVENGYDLEIVTSSFRHLTKKQRNINKLNLDSLPYKVTLLHEPGYNKNISIFRLYSHYILGKNIEKYLKKRKKPDVIIVSVPSLSVANVVTKYAKLNKIKVIVDIQDLWPEAFKIAINIPILSELIFFPMKLHANKIYSRADRIIAVSDTYVKRGLKCNVKDKNGLSIYIGTDPGLVLEETKGKIVHKPNNEFWIGYIGALGHSYDIKLVIDAIDNILLESRQKIVFKVMGDGILRSEFEAYAKVKGVDCDFTGFLDYGKMMAILKVCDVAVNPIVGDSVSSIINKVSDYAIAGIPVINSQNSKEYRDLLKRYKCGINCNCGDSNDVAKAILYCIENPYEVSIMGKNAKILGNEKFDRRRTYPKVVELIEELIKNE